MKQWNIFLKVRVIRMNFGHILSAKGRMIKYCFLTKLQWVNMYIHKYLTCGILNQGPWDFKAYRDNLPLRSFWLNNQHRLAWSVITVDVWITKGFLKSGFTEKWDVVNLVLIKSNDFWDSSDHSKDFDFFNSSVSGWVISAKLASNHRYHPAIPMNLRSCLTVFGSG